MHCSKRSFFVAPMIRIVVIILLLLCIPLSIQARGIVPGSPCDDGNACTQNDITDPFGLCFGTTIHCDDGNPATIDSCDPTRGCIYTQITTTYSSHSCNDGNACTQGEYLDHDGNCVNGTPVICNDNNNFTEDSCNPTSGCVFIPRGEARIKGDADGDGQITSRDALVALQVSVGKRPFDANLDVNSDGKVDIEDASSILQTSVISPGLPYYDVPNRERGSSIDDLKKIFESTPVPSDLSRQLESLNYPVILDSGPRFSTFNRGDIAPSETYIRAISSQFFIGERRFPPNTGEPFVIPDSIGRPIRVDQVHPLPSSSTNAIVYLPHPSNSIPSQYSNFYIQEGTFIEILGDGFGDCNDASCGVRLEFLCQTTGEQESIGTNPYCEGVNATVILYPYNMNWTEAWSNQVITVFVPVFALLKENREATLIIYRQGKATFALNIPVYLIVGSPTILSFQSTPPQPTFLPDSAKRISPGTTILIEGHDFGTDTGEIEIVFDEPLSGLADTHQGTNQYMTGLSKATLSVSSWDDHWIRADVPPSPFPHTYQVNGTLKVYNIKKKPYPAEKRVIYSPKKVLIWTSGAKYFSPENVDKNDASTVLSKQHTVMVLHDPGCRSWIFSKGNNGNDQFFTTKPLPQECRVIKTIVSRIDPEDAGSSFMKYYNLVTSNIIGTGWITGIANLFDEGIGSYKIELNKQPTENDPSMVVHWENTCIGNNAGKDLVYVATFFIECPEGWDLGP